MNDDIKVKIVAIAKDEGAYIAEWVFHHLFIGVDAIDVYINRTTDNSFEVMDRINKEYPQVNCYSADWTDYCHPQVGKHLQYVVYGKAFEENRLSKEFDYILFIDVDEFWFSKGLRKNIKEIIRAANKPIAMVFQWINEMGEEPPFRKLGQTVKGFLHRNVKTMLHRNAPVKKLMLHYSELDNGKVGVFCDNQQFESEEKQSQLLKKELSKLRDVMIIHRNNRSEIEYVSLLSRGRPSDDIPIKLNRHGYNVGKKLIRLELEADVFQRYRKERELFFKRLDIETIIKEGQLFVLKRAERCIDSIDKVLQNHPQETRRVFCNVNYKSVVEKLAIKAHAENSNVSKDSQDEEQFIPTFFSCLNALFKKDANYLRDTATYFETRSLWLANFFIRRAFYARPNGALILRKMQRYALLRSRKSSSE
ncbi:glycosyltransferase family 2 protein [Aliikangiella sp. G2MR2-5]|uniref:glycosyltransferase family 2 protein n=1 Tax=Aliikangiella sp. G2MR2-5 TaxID=2788943 RepID=UPI0018AA5DC2